MSPAIDGAARTTDARGAVTPSNYSTEPVV